MKKEEIQLIEAVLFIKGNEGIDIKDLSVVLKKSQKITKDLIERYIAEVSSDDKRGFEVKLFGDVYKLVTKINLFDSLNKIVIDKQARLTQAALETLTIIAYKQPISKTEIERIRGVNADYAVRKLLTFDLIEETGRAQTAGLPIIYGTTPLFLDKFDIKKLDDLPEFKQLVDEGDITREMKLFDYD
jgi:segregation and condensation protein B